MGGWSDKPAEFWAHAEKICTPRELEVLKLRAEGKSTYRVASVLGISGTRVKQLRARAQDKLCADLPAPTGKQSG